MKEIKLLSESIVGKDVTIDVSNKKTEKLEKQMADLN